MDLVRNGGGETSGDGELLVSEESFLRFAGQGDIAEDQDDADDVSVRVADGGSAVVDEELSAVFSYQDGVVGEADGAIEPCDLGDGVLDRFTGGLVEDVEDAFEGEIAGGGFVPPGELLGDIVHGLNEALFAAGDDPVADGLEGGAELLLGAEGLFGADAERVVGLAVGVGDLVDQAPGVEADGESDDAGKTDEGDGHGVDLTEPVGDGLVAFYLGTSGEGADASANVVHLALAEEVELDVGGVAPGLDGGDQG